MKKLWLGCLFAILLVIAVTSVHAQSASYREITMPDMRYMELAENANETDRALYLASWMLDFCKEGMTFREYLTVRAEREDIVSYYATLEPTNENGRWQVLMEIMLNEYLGIRIFSDFLSDEQVKEALIFIEEGHYDGEHFMQFAIEQPIKHASLAIKAPFSDAEADKLGMHAFFSETINVSLKDLVKDN